MPTLLALLNILAIVIGALGNHRQLNVIVTAERGHFPHFRQCATDSDIISSTSVLDSPLSEARWSWVTLLCPVLSIVWVKCSHQRSGACQA